MSGLDVHAGPDAWEVRWEQGRANALSASLVEQLIEVVERAGRDDAPALVLRGGRQHFAAGIDLGDLGTETDASLAHRFLRIGILLERLATAPFLTVAAVTGPAIGAGADLVAACDHRLALDNVPIAFPGSRFGVVLGTARLAQMVGTDRALALVGGRRVAAGSSGLATPCADGTALDAAVSGLLADWSRTDPAARPALLAASRPTDPDAALAALARSVARPGLRERITAYATTVGITPTADRRDPEKENA